MPKYVNADKIIEHLNDEIEGCGDCDVYSQPVVYGTRLGLEYSKSLVETAESADVREVVRCKHGVNIKYNVFDKFKSMNIDELAEWLDKYGMFDNSPWMSWFDQKYCKNCEDIMCKYEDSEREFPCSYCELNGNCKFFPDLDEVPDNKMSIKMWLESEIHQGE